MGYLRHQALIVNGWDGAAVTAAHAEVSAIYGAPEEGDFGRLVSPIIPHVMNGGASFFIAPDGSKEGWADSQEGDRLREAAKEAIARHQWVDWCEVLCGGDDDRFAVLSSSAPALLYLAYPSGRR